MLWQEGTKLGAHVFLAETWQEVSVRAQENAGSEHSSCHPLIDTKNRTLSFLNEIHLPLSLVTFKYVFPLPPTHNSKYSGVGLRLGLQKYRLEIHKI